MHKFQLHFMLWITILVNVASSTPDETRLINNLLNGYHRRARPVINVNETVQVEIMLYIKNLNEVNTKSQYICIIGWVTTIWKDERLTWNPADYGGLNYVALSPEEIWVPTYVLANTVSEYLYNEFWYTLFKVKVWNNGRIIWAPGGKFQAECLIDIQWFPFDEQICYFRFENWIYTGDKVNLTHLTKAKDLFLKYYNGIQGQWDIIDSNVYREDTYYSLNVPFPKVLFGLHLRRKVLFYVVNLILVSILLACLVLVMFKLPPESGERISMGVTLLLSFSLFILMVNDSVPETSSAVPIIVVYLISLMSLTSLSIIQTTVVLYCYHHLGDSSPPKLFTKRGRKTNEENLKTNMNKVSLGDNIKKFDSSIHTIDQLITKSQIYLSEENFDHAILDNHRYDGSSKESSICSETIKKRRENTTYEIEDEIGNHDTQVKSSEKPPNIPKSDHSGINKERNIEEWKHLANLIDRISFWVCLFLFVLFMVIFLVILPNVFGRRNINIYQEL